MRSCSHPPPKGTQSPQSTAAGTQRPPGCSPLSSRTPPAQTRGTQSPQSTAAGTPRPPGCSPLSSRTPPAQTRGHSVTTVHSRRHSAPTWLQPTQQQDPTCSDQRHSVTTVHSRRHSAPTWLQPTQQQDPTCSDQRALSHHSPQPQALRAHLAAAHSAAGPHLLRPEGTQSPQSTAAGTPRPPGCSPLSSRTPPAQTRGHSVTTVHSRRHSAPTWLQPTQQQDPTCSDQRALSHHSPQPQALRAHLAAAHSAAGPHLLRPEGTQSPQSTAAGTPRPPGCSPLSSRTPPAQTRGHSVTTVHSRRHSAPTWLQPTQQQDPTCSDQRAA
ncbi:hypothetical protein P7K49_018768 [Saguinus oedipus]|uniref:Uncharacterized protein n=1 Tax=Saguinus oedipus TaxID=9490 RepID=A0ABQ9V6B3_SAGOE|nr:hypothetical protein P7K49_018768 [Saguinus oedipus]